MYYFLIASDGQHYGPADVDTLVAWAREGRLVEASLLEERGSGRQLHAGDLTAVRSVLRQPSVSDAVVIERNDAPNWRNAPTMARDAAPQAEAPHGAPPPPPPPPTMGYAGRYTYPRKSRIVAGLLGIFLGAFGVHRFYLGYIWVGLIQLTATILSCGIASVWGLVEGIICLAGGMTDADGRELGD